jgi:outer membrane immunogenic protein
MRDRTTGLAPRLSCEITIYVEEENGRVPLSVTSDHATGTAGTRIMRNGHQTARRFGWRAAIGAIIASSALTVSATQASAFNLLDRIWPQTSAQLAVPNWDGAYINHDFSFDSFDVSGSASAGFNDLDGHRIGGQVGYDYTIGNFLIGGVIQGGWGTNNDDGTGPLFGYKADLKSLGIFRARAGFTFDRFLVYGTGGIALADVRVTGFGVRQEETLTGWAAGGGVEYAWNQGASIRFEYQRVELDDKTFSNLPGGVDRLGIEGHVFDFGFIRRF